MNRFKEPPLAGPTAKELWDKNIELQQRIVELEADYRELARLRKAEAVDNLANERRIAELEAALRDIVEEARDYGSFAWIYERAEAALGGDDE